MRSIGPMAAQAFLMFGGLAMSDGLGPVKVMTCPRKFPRSDVDSAQPEGADDVRKSRFTEAQIIGMIKEQEAGQCQRNQT